MRSRRQLVSHCSSVNLRIAIAVCLLAFMLLPANAHAKRPSTGLLIYPLKHNIDLQEGTIECWIKLNIEPDDYLPAKSFTGLASIFAFSGDKGAVTTSFFTGSVWGNETFGWHVRFSPRDKLLPIGSPVKWHKDEWHHFALVWQGTRTTFYLDGKQVSERNHPTSLKEAFGGLGGKNSFPPHPFYFGERWNVGANYVLDDIRVSAVARQPEELGYHVGELKPDPYTIILDRCETLTAAGKKRYVYPAMMWDGDRATTTRLNHIVGNGKFGKAISFVQPPDAPDAPDASPAPEMEPSEDSASQHSAAIAPADWMRHPILGLPSSTSPKSIDGAVGKREWFDAASVDALTNAEDSLAADLRATFKLARSDTHLYFAFQADRPSHNLRPTDEDEIELRLDPNGKGESAVVFRFNHSEITEIKQIGNQRIDGPDGSIMRYKASLTPSGWEGEAAIPFAALKSQSPRANEVWKANVSRIDVTPVRMTSRWAYTGRFPYDSPTGMSHDGKLVFLDEPIAVSVRSGWLSFYREVGTLTHVSNFSDKPIRVSVQSLLSRSGSVQEIPLVAAIDDELTDDLGRPRGKVEDELAKALAVFKPLVQKQTDVLVPANSTKLIKAVAPDSPGDYVTGTHVLLNDQPIAAGLISARVPDHLGLSMRIHQLSQAVQYSVNLKRLEDELSDDAALDVQLLDASGNQLASKQYGNLKQILAIDDAFAAKLDFASVYTVHASVRQGDKQLAERSLSGSTASTDQLPLWWTMDTLKTPLIPEPWHPVDVQKNTVKTLGREYIMSNQALPTSIQTRGSSILAGPIVLSADQPWHSQSSKLSEADDEAATFISELQADGVTARVTNRIEFDGFMLIDIELSGSGTLNNLDLHVPFKTEFAQLLQNYRPAPGPGESQHRFHGAIPEEGYASRAFYAYWVGTDHLGLEFSCESTRGWSMAEPDRAMRIKPNGDVTDLHIGFISRPVKLSADRPRRIRFSLVATPTKTVVKHMRDARMYDDVHVALLPYDWAGFPAWHPPITDDALAKEKREWVKTIHDRGQKLLVNGGWAVSVQDQTNLPWVHEMFRAPLMNVSYSGARQFAYCYHTPYAKFLANSFVHNARTLKFDGIRFDTVTPGYTCQHPAHGCAWQDDDGNTWPTVGIFSQREAWKTIYRAFHGGVLDGGIVYTPNAAGPIMAVHSFSDVHEIGEGFYQKAKNLKTGYPPGMVRSIMTGDPYGFVTQANLKMGPLFYNERIGALLVNGANPRFHDYRFWDNTYGRQGCPAIAIWEAWDWVDRYQADWLGWWENEQYINVENKQDDVVYASLYRRNDKPRVLLTITNYEEHAIGKLPVKLNLQKLGLTGQPVYAVDAITKQPIAISPDGLMHLDLLLQRYRLICISNEKPTYHEDNLGEAIVIDAPSETSESWQSKNLALEPSSVYVLQTEIRIDKEIGSDAKRPNEMQRFSPYVRHTANIALVGKGVHGINGSENRGPPADYADSDWYKRKHRPTWWTPTDGFFTMFLPVRTDENGIVGKVYLSLSESGAATFRAVKLRKVVQ